MTDASYDSDLVSDYSEEEYTEESDIDRYIEEEEDDLDEEARDARDRALLSTAPGWERRFVSGRRIIDESVEEPYDETVAELIEEDEETVSRELTVETVPEAEIDYFVGDTDEKYIDRTSSTRVEIDPSVRVTTSYEERGDKTDQSFIAVDGSFGDVENLPSNPLDGKVPTELLTTRRRTSNTVIREVEKPKVSRRMRNADNDTKVQLETPTNLVNSNENIKAKRRITYNRRGNVPEDSPYEIKQKNSLVIPIEEEIETQVETDSRVNIEPLAKLDPKRLKSNSPTNWYSLPYLRSVLNATGAVKILPTHRRPYIVKTAEDLIAKYRVEYVKDEV